MKTTLIIPDPVFHNLKRQAAQRRTTMSELASDLLRKGLSEPPKRFKLPPLPSFKMGWPPRVDINSREALYDFLEAERDQRLYGAKRKA